ncbi:ABC transporter ATP-binding protein [Rosenbergiella epipactidis]|uniref:ABC transporter ATP-binding protein n=1 Tax=Rosenbergiella epipactidis TaxID=1544694 RepID=UPI00202727DB|nr:ABC transporter ATP-binding protein [Rosenbergiella epipactidis]MCL9669565.1 ABC transporter ATP-binding protein [Rosenbergiella epipactidis]
MREDCIILNNIHKSFGDVKVINDVTLNILQGQIVGFIGPNGSGKSTMINIICGMIPSDSGQGFCMGYDISTEQAYIKKNVGYMTQYFTLWESLTVLENLVFIGKMRNVRKVDAESEKLIIRLGLERFRNTLAKNLSGGWKQKLSLACAIIHRPKILFLDEPTASIDPLARKEFWTLIFELAGEGMTILIVTHAIDEIEKCHHLVYLKNGVLQFTGNLEELFSSQNIPTYLIEGEGLEHLNAELSCKDDLQIIPRVKSISVTGYLQFETLKIKYPNITFNQIPTPLDALLYSLSSN